MRRLLLLLISLLCASPAWAWNAAGHRLSAVIAWQQLSDDSRQWLDGLLRQHEDYPRWREKSGTGDRVMIFAEAATWADSIRNDPRYSDSTAGQPGAGDYQRHGDWHYLNLDAHGRVQGGQLEKRLGDLARLLRSTASNEQKAWALPWLIHLLGDIHQPLHVGYHDDRGGNRHRIDDPDAPRHKLTDLHSYWDDLPGPSGLRGKRLLNRARQLLNENSAPQQGTIRQWRDESRGLLGRAYPTPGSNRSVISAAFRNEAQAIADQRIVDAGYRLAGLLEEIAAVSRETGD